MEIGKDKLEEMLRTILTIRNFETRAEQLFAEGHIPGSFISISEKKQWRPACAPT